MFNPSAAKGQAAVKAAKKKLENALKEQSLALVPPALREGIMIDVKEVQCGDPSCSPIDTVFTFIWPPVEGQGKPGRGMFGLPYSLEEIGSEDLQDMFPDEPTLTKWRSGKSARWPPPPVMAQPRFAVGERVECRIGPHPVKGWAAGRVVKLFYRESSWPAGMIAPYQIALHDGRLIFAPKDLDEIIRKRPDPASDAPSSPDLSEHYNYSESAGVGGDEDDDDEEEEEDEGMWDTLEGEEGFDEEGEEDGEGEGEGEEEGNGAMEAGEGEGEEGQKHVFRKGKGRGGGGGRGDDDI